VANFRSAPSTRSTQDNTLGSLRCGRRFGRTPSRIAGGQVRMMLWSLYESTGLKSSTSSSDRFSRKAMLSGTRH
jgi:hypothetical protein